MTFNELYVALKSANISQKRIKSSKVLNAPYMVVCEGNSDYGGADNAVLLAENTPRIELYTTETDYTSFNALCNVLISNNIAFVTSDEIAISDEGIFVRYFDLEIQINKIGDEN